MNRVKVISADIDGADLRRQKIRNPRYSRCSGTADDRQINDAIENCNKGKLYSVPADRWQEIFGGMNHG